MEPDDLTIDPGSQITTKVTVRNIGTRVEEFELVVQGPGAEFATVIPATVSVYPDVEQRAVVRFAPLRGPQSPAGVSTFEVVARSVVHADVRDVARGRLTVTAFEDLQAVLKPDASRGRKPARHLVSVTNGGNTPMNSQVSLTDQDKVLTFEPPNTAVTLQPGGTAEVPVLLNGPRRWFGRTERLPFAAVVTPAGTQQPITLNGTRQQTPVFPWWMPPAALVIVALAIGLAALIHSLLGPPKVPSIGEVAQAVAEKQLTDAGYLPDSIPLGNDRVAKGQAINTDPAASTPLDKGEHVKLFISSGPCGQGPCPVPVPIVAGLPVTEAQSKLEDKGFTVQLNRVASDTVPADRVIASKPDVATMMHPPDMAVQLTVSTGLPQNPAEQAAADKAAADKAATEKAATEKAATEKAATEKAATEKAAAEKAAAAAAAAAAAGKMPVPVPNLTARSVEDATKALTDLGLKVAAKTETAHSNAIPNDQVLSTTPAKDSKAEPGSEVTLTVAKNTAVDLIAAASKADWTGKDGTTLQVTDTATGTGVARITKDGSSLLVTTPGPGGSITGVYTLTQPIISGDHLRARIGQLTDADKFTFVVKADGNPVQTTIKTVRINNIPFQELDADLSLAKDATKIEITVKDAATTAQQAEWHEFRLASPTG